MMGNKLQTKISCTLRNEESHHFFRPHGFAPEIRCHDLRAGMRDNPPQDQRRGNYQNKNPGSQERAAGFMIDINLEPRWR